MTRVALDSNVLAYFLGVDRHPDDSAKVTATRSVIDRLTGVTLVAPAQALGELYNVLLKAGATRGEAHAGAMRVRRAYRTAPTHPDTLDAALDVAVQHRLQIWDAIILCASAEAGCSMLLSEDMHPGLTVRGVTVVNPFTEKIAAPLARLLQG